MRTLSVFGTRPEAIKFAPVLRELERREGVISRVCVTAQHREMLDQMLTSFGVRPDRDLNLMRPGQSLFDVTSEAIRRLRGVLEEEEPDVVLVQGDTTTALAACMAAYYLRIPVGHIEAGLRTNDKYSPFPEEMNRRWVDVASDWRFAPTEWAKENLLREGIDEATIRVTGNTVVDALLWTLQEQKSGDQQAELGRRLVNECGVSAESERLLLVTGHRRESFGEGFEQICLGLREIATSYPDIQIVYPVHLNPNVRQPVNRILGGLANVSLIDPLDYELFVFLMNHAYFILTDSGGIQEEAPSLSKPVLIMREKTDRPEAITAGVACLVGTRSEAIVAQTRRLLDNRDDYESMAKGSNPFGDGTAAVQIVGTLMGAYENAV